MASKNQIQFKKLKKNHVGLVIILYILTIVIMVALLSFAFLGVIFSSFSTKMVNEYGALYYLSKIYEKGVEAGDDKIFDLLDASGREYRILDAEGKALHQNGEGSYLEGSALLDISSLVVTTFQDAEQSGLLTANKKYWTVNYGKIIKDSFENWRNIDYSDPAFSTFDVTAKVPEDETGWNIEMYSTEMDEDEFEEYMDEMRRHLRDVDAKIVSYPMWFALPIREGREVIVGKVYYSINIEDASNLIVMVIAMIILALMVMILMIVSMVRGMLRQKKVINLYLTDPVTGGHNWMWFLLRGEPVLRLARNAGKKYAVMEIVFINYRNFCVCHSVEEGEKILIKIYQTLVKTLGKKSMCAHAATSSFAVIQRYEDEEELKAKLRQLIQDLENVDPSHKFAFHMGVNLLPELRNKNGRPIKRKKLNLEAEYNNACTARMTLEESDDSRIAYFDEKMVEEQRWLDSVTERQQAAVEREEFKVYYQPKYDPRDGKLCGAEALIRWDSPDLGFVSPGRFIPLFEKNGFITEIDHYMISHVAKDQKAWMDQGLTCVPVSVNVSRAHFIEKDLAEQICRMVDDAGTPHHLIEIELTESAFFDDKNAMISTITKLKQAGFAVSMDDFGSGYSSLNSLKDMPLDVLKLDAEFFRGENAGERGEIVVSEAIKLARSLNMRTVAEGVEEKSQVQFLAEKGCDMIQGYYFAKPMPKGDYVERMRAGYSEKAEKAVENAVDATEGENTDVAGVAEGEVDLEAAEYAMEVENETVMETVDNTADEAFNVGDEAKESGKEMTAQGEVKDETQQSPKEGQTAQGGAKDDKQQDRTMIGEAVETEKKAED